MKIWGYVKLKDLTSRKVKVTGIQIESKGNIL